MAPVGVIYFKYDLAPYDCMNPKLTIEGSGALIFVWACDPWIPGTI